MNKLYTVCYLEKDNKVLMLYRDKKENDINHGKWLGVGGKLEAGESPYQCAKREVFEETGFTTNSLDFRGVISFSIDSTDDDEYIFVFSSKDFTGTLNNYCKEGSLSWIDKDKLLELNIWESDRLLLEYIKNDNYNTFMLRARYENNKLVDYVEEITSKTH